MSSLTSTGCKALVKLCIHTHTTTFRCRRAPFRFPFAYSSRRHHPMSASKQVINLQFLQRELFNKNQLNAGPAEQKLLPLEVVALWLSGSLSLSLSGRARSYLAELSAGRMRIGKPVSLREHAHGWQPWHTRWKETTLRDTCCPLLGRLRAQCAFGSVPIV